MPEHTVLHSSIVSFLGRKRNALCRVHPHLNEFFTGLTVLLFLFFRTCFNFGDVSGSTSGVHTGLSKMSSLFCRISFLFLTSRSCIVQYTPHCIILLAHFFLFCRHAASRQKRFMDFSGNGDAMLNLDDLQRCVVV